jgi:hypothetical protein
MEANKEANITLHTHPSLMVRPPKSMKFLLILADFSPTDKGHVRLAVKAADADVDVDLL